MKRILFIVLLWIGISVQAKDLDMFRLIGPVDSVCVELDDAGLIWQTEYKFDIDGFLTHIDGMEVNMDRNEHDQITDFIIEEDDEDNEPVTIATKIEYDKGGRVIRTTTSSTDEEWTEIFTYNHEGHLVSREYQSPDAMETFTYAYLKFDSMGNWIERQEKIGSMDQVINQKRHITYR